MLLQVFALGFAFPQLRDDIRVSLGRNLMGGSCSANATSARGSLQVGGGSIFVYAGGS